MGKRIAYASWEIGEAARIEQALEPFEALAFIFQAVPLIHETHDLLAAAGNVVLALHERATLMLVGADEAQEEPEKVVPHDQ